MGVAEYVRPRHMNVDIETFSDEDIGKAGLYRYAQSPAFEVLLFAYSLDGGQTATIVMNDELVNRPVYGQQRKISDIIYFATAVPEGGAENG